MGSLQYRMSSPKRNAGPGSADRQPRPARDRGDGLALAAAGLSITSLPVPMIMVDDGGVVLWRNRHADRHRDLHHLTAPDRQLDPAGGPLDRAVLSACANALDTGACSAILEQVRGSGGGLQLALAIRLDGALDGGGAISLVILWPQVVLQREAVDYSAGGLLTPVEQNLVREIAGGAAVRDAAIELGITYHTARKYLQTIYRKLGVTRVNELVSRVLRGETVGDPDGAPDNPQG